MYKKIKVFLVILSTIILSGCINKDIDKTENININTTTKNIFHTENLPLDNINNSADNKNEEIKNIDIENKNNNNEIKNMATEEKNPIAIIKTSAGDIKIELYKNFSPITVENFIELSKNNFYNGTKFHRVIKDFMIQGGDPLTKDNTKMDSWGTGGPGYKFDDEINNTKLVKGSLAMANSGPNTNGSQFFIITADATPWLDGVHTNFGTVIEGMDVIMNIQNVETNSSDKPIQDIFINSIEIKE